MIFIILWDTQERTRPASGRLQQEFHQFMCSTTSCHRWS